MTRNKNSFCRGPTAFWSPTAHCELDQSFLSSKTSDAPLLSHSSERSRSKRFAQVYFGILRSLSACALPSSARLMPVALLPASAAPATAPCAAPAAAPASTAFRVFFAFIRRRGDDDFLPLFLVEDFLPALFLAEDADFLVPADFLAPLDFLAPVDFPVPDFFAGVFPAALLTFFCYRDLVFRLS